MTYTEKLDKAEEVNKWAVCFGFCLVLGGFFVLVLDFLVWSGVFLVGWLGFFSFDLASGFFG